MALNSITKTLLVVLAVLALIYFLLNCSPIKNEGLISLNGEAEVLPENIEESVGVEEVDDNKNIPIEDAEMNRYFTTKDYAPPEGDWLNSKFKTRNKSSGRGYVHSSYDQGLRGELGPSDWNAYFKHNNNVIGNAQTGDNDQFLPMDESNGEFAVFKTKGRASCGSNQNCEPEDLFDVDKYLPQEVNDDWFEVQPEPISVKNRHLINITKPIGINTIGSSLRNASYDIRMAPNNPKFAISPWLNSNIEPDINVKPLF
jgi:hypothetical protein